ncbi:hypothetical protein OG21DRAFT_1527081 [Imleria badia]|nr:hypothetical protein OG21DRAFT_1527081 [Imleria badia]
MTHSLSPTIVLPALVSLHACSAARLGEAPSTPRRRTARLVHHDGVPDSGYASAEEDDHDEEDGGEETRNINAVDEGELEALEMLRADEIERGYAVMRTLGPDVYLPYWDVSSPAPPITVELNVDGSDHIAVGLQSWGSAIVFAARMYLDPERYLGALHPSSAVTTDTETKPRQLLELGAGTGLLSITAAQILSRTSVQAEIKTADYHLSVLENLAWNVRRNPGMVDVDEGGGVYDVVLAADVVYYPEHARWIRGCVERTLSKGGVFWMIIPVRTTGRHEGLEETVEEAFPVVGDGERLAIVRREHVERVDGVGRADEGGLRTESADVNPFKVTTEILRGRKYLVIRVIPEPPNEMGRDARLCIAKEKVAYISAMKAVAPVQVEQMNWVDRCRLPARQRGWHSGTPSRKFRREVGQSDLDGQTYAWGHLVRQKRAEEQLRDEKGGNQVEEDARTTCVRPLSRWSASNKGKNDGSIQGIAYFSCRPLHGVFICPSQVKVLPPEPDQPPANAISALPAPVSPGPLHYAPQLRVLLPPPLVQPSQSTTIGDFTWQVKSSYTIPSRTTVKRIPSPSLQPRKSFPRQSTAEMYPPSPSPTSTRMTAPPVPAPSSSQPDKASITVTSTRTTMLSPLTPLTSSPQPQSQPLHQSPVPEHASLLPPAQITPSSSLMSAPASTTHSLTNRSGHARAISITREPSSPIAICMSRLRIRAQTRVMEAKRADDARHIRELETCLNEAESFVALRPKLQAKLNQLQTELIRHSTGCGGKAESAQAELEEVKEKLAQMEVELQVLKDGGGKYLYRMKYDSTDDEVAIGEEGEAEAKSSLAYIHLEKHNERLREALIWINAGALPRWRWTSRASTIFNVYSTYPLPVYATSDTSTYNRLMISKPNLMMHWEQNLMLGDKIEDMHITIEDLGLSKNSMTTWKKIISRWRRPCKRKSTQRIPRFENTCKRFRRWKMSVKIWRTLSLSSESSYYSYRGNLLLSALRALVTILSSELDNLRSQTRTAQHESATAASQTAAMMSLNLKLQLSAAKNQVNTVQLGVRKLEVKESRELLGIVQPYLPQLYVESDSDATSCYLFFWRMGLKIDLINTVVGQAHGLPESLHGDVSETVVGICEMGGRRPLSLYSASGSLCDIVKLQAQFDHLAETYFSRFDRDLGEDVVLDMGRYDPEPELFEPLQKLRDQCKSAKVLSKKLTKRLEVIFQDSAALKAHLFGQLKSSSNAVSELVNFGISEMVSPLPKARKIKNTLNHAGAIQDSPKIPPKRFRFFQDSIVCKIFFVLFSFFSFPPLQELKVIT